MLGPLCASFCIKIIELDVTQTTNSNTGYKIYNLLRESNPLSSPYRGDVFTTDLSGHDMITFETIRSIYFQIATPIHCLFDLFYITFYERLHLRWH
jgi:hypothetical protein